MKRHILLIVTLSVLALVTVACGGRKRSAEPVDVSATVEAAVAATTEAEAAMQAAVDAAVQATVTAIVPEATATPTAPEATPTPVIVTETVTETEVVYVPQDVYVTMTEEELAALIDQAVEQAVAATEDYSEATQDATSDGEVTSDEVQEIQVYVDLAEETVAYAEELVAAYSDIYAESTAAVVEALAGIEEELATISDNTAAMAASLDEMNQTLEAGLTLAEETIGQIEQTAAQAQSATSQALAQADALQTTVQQAASLRSGSAQADPQSFARILTGVQPQQVADDPQAALALVRTYADTTQSALADSALDPSEMMAIAQAGANATASLQAQGGRPFQGISRTIDSVNNALARGDITAAQQGLAGLETQLPSGVNAGEVGRPNTGAPSPGRGDGGNRGSGRNR